MVQPHTRGDPPASPWVYDTQDAFGNHLTVTIPFNETTLALQDATTFKDRNCMYNKLVFDVPSDSQRAKRFNIVDGSHTIQSTVLANNGFFTYNDLMAVQVTAEP